MLNKFRDGITKILSEDRDSQLHYFKVLAETRYVDIEFFFKYGVFFVPNNDYLYKYLGIEAINPMYDLYDSMGECKWVGHYMVPILDSLNEIVGFTGFNPFSKAIKIDNELLGKDDVVPPKYIVSSKKVFDKNSHFLVPNGYRKAIDEGYILVMDGVFDAMTVASEGLNSACAFGSDFGDKLKFKLSFVKTKFVPYDNDKAGLEFFTKIRSSLNNTYSITQGKCKDLDQYIYENGFDNFIKKLKYELNSPIPKSIIL